MGRRFDPDRAHDPMNLVLWTLIFPIDSPKTGHSNSMKKEFKTLFKILLVGE